MSAKPKLELVSSFDGEIDKPWPLIPERDYELKLQWWETGLMLGRYPKLTLWFSVMEYGEHFGTLLPRYYNVVRFIGRWGRGGRFVPPRSGDFVREYAQLLDPPGRLHKFSLAEVKRHIVVGRVETVTTSAKQNKLPTACQYSVVRELLRLNI